MKTKIIIVKGWIEIAEYDYLITMSPGDIVVVKDMEYDVKRCSLDIEGNTMFILVKI